MRGRLAAGLAAATVLSTALAACSGDAKQPSTAYQTPAATPTPTVDPEELGFDPKVLDRLADRAEEAGSTCLLVARDGKVAAQWYWNDGAADKPQEVFSVTKSITSTLVGIAQADGDLSIEDPAADYIPEWKGTDSADVTVRNLLSNDSGRFWTTKSDYGDLLQATDKTAYAVGLDQAAAPGSVWAYNNAAIQTLDEVIRSATGEDTATFAQERLLGPLGMTSSRMTGTADGAETNAFYGLQSTCPDLEHFGRLFLQQGEWDGEQLVPKAWVEDAVGDSSQDLNAAYGLLWWLNREGNVRQPIDDDNPGLPPGVAKVGKLVPGAPDDMFAALGFGGQVVLVDPGSGTVVVRLGNLRAASQSGADAYTIADAAEVVTEALTN